MSRTNLTNSRFWSRVLAGIAMLTPTHALALGEVTKGANELGDANAERAKAKEVATEATDTTELALQGGGLLASGNAQSLAVTAGSRFFLRRGLNEVTANVVGNYARAAQADAAKTVATTVENFQAKLRYDRFVSDHFSGFFALYARHDQFQGLDLRFALDPGLAGYFVRSDARSLWLEAGYDLQIDDRSSAALITARAAGTPESELVDPKVVHNARFYFGYKEKLEDRLKFEFGTEFLKSLMATEAFRWNVAAELNTQLIDRFSLSIGVLSFYDSAPLAGVRNHDLLTTLSFVYTML